MLKMINMLFIYVGRDGCSVAEHADFRVITCKAEHLTVCTCVQVVSDIVI